LGRVGDHFELADSFLAEQERDAGRNVTTTAIVPNVVDSGYRSNRSRNTMPEKNSSDPFGKMPASAQRGLKTAWRDRRAPP
jgi:hypothetical protein